ncbi:hypothetical protein [Desertivirga xinjiangensis]|uniref:hypothetical protein n=1 Tax=Desertivirga xinjiangensis TaxID=539206 RepID=UPI00210A1E52|nr:hypothetical protein [Pedobacter xinjiangensis]
MKKLLVIIYLLISSIAYSQSQFDNQTAVTSADGVVYNVLSIGGGNKVRVMNSANTLHNVVKNYPIKTTDDLVISNILMPLTPLNQNFSKEKLLAFKNDPAKVRVFVIFDRNNVIREVSFFLAKNTSFLVDDLQKLEAILKTCTMYFHRLSDQVNGRPAPSRNADYYPELSGIPYFSAYVTLDFSDAYNAVYTRDRRGNLVWTFPSN